MADWVTEKLIHPWESLTRGMVKSDGEGGKERPSHLAGCSNTRSSLEKNLGGKIQGVEKDKGDTKGIQGNSRPAAGGSTGKNAN